MNPLKPHDNIEQLLRQQEQLHHRAVALELALRDAYRQRQVSKKAYQDRSQFIKKAIDHLSRTKTFLQNMEHGRQNSEFGLPKLQDCSPEELSVVSFFLGERRQLLSGLIRESSDISKWLQCVTFGKSGWIRTLFRLSKLRKKLSKLEHLRLFQNQEEDLTENATKLFMKGQPNHRQRLKVGTTLEGLMTVFGELNKLASRVAKLQQNVAKEQTTVKRMEQWLELKQQDLRALTPSPPPSLDDMYEAELKAQSISQAPLQRTEERLVLARRWAEQTETHHGFDHSATAHMVDQLRENSTMTVRRRQRKPRARSRCV